MDIDKMYTIVTSNKTIHKLLNQMVGTHDSELCNMNQYRNSGTPLVIQCLYLQSSPHISKLIKCHLLPKTIIQYFAFP